MYREILKRGCVCLNVFSNVVLFCSVDAAEYAYVTNYGGNYPAVSQVDLKTLQIVKNFNLNDGNLPHPSKFLGGIAITPNNKYIFAGDLGENTELSSAGNIISKIDMVTGKITNISYQHLMPFSLAVIPNGKSLLVTSLLNNKIACIDTTTNAIEFVDNNNFIITYPRYVTVTPDGKNALVAGGQNLGSLFVLDINQKKIINQIESPSFSKITSIAISQDGKAAYLTNLISETVSVIDLIQQKWLYDILGINEPLDIAISPSGKKAHVSAGLNPNSEMLLYELDLTQGQSAEPHQIEVEIKSSGGELAFNSSGSKLYISAFEANKLLVMDTTTNQLLGSVSNFSGNIIDFAITPLPYAESFSRCLRKFSPVSFQKSTCY